MFVLKTVRAKNFLTIGNSFAELNLNSYKTTCIMGKNGQGKSSLGPEAICFGLFGRSYRGVNKPQLVNEKNGKACVVEVDLDVDGTSYRIKRGIKPNLFEIYKEGTLVDQDKSRDYQEFLEKNILKTDFRSFTQIVVLGSASFIPFLRMDAKARREFVEQLLDVNVFSMMHKIMKQELSQWKSELQDKEFELERTETKISAKKEVIFALSNTDIEQELVSKRAELKSLRVRCMDVMDKVQSLTADIDSKTEVDLDQLQRKINTLSIESKSKKSQQLALEAETRRISALGGADCPQCAQSVPLSHVEAIKQSKQSMVDALVAEQQAIEPDIEALNTELQQAKMSNDELKDLRQERSKLETQAEMMIDQSKGLIAGISKLEQNSQQSQISYAEGELKVLQDLLAGQKFDLATHKKKEDTFEVCKRLLKDDGIKARIIKQYVPQINKSLNAYLSALNFPYTIKINEAFEDTVWRGVETPLSYHSLSMGERLRVDLAMMFVWRDVARLKNSVNTNLLFIDEIMDANLDANGVFDMMQILQEQKDTNVFIISHRSDLLQDYADLTIEVTKKNGFSEYTVV